MYNEKMWVEKYRPQTIDECVLPAKTKAFFKSLVEKGEFPNLLLEGDAGCGKTTVAKALCNEMGLDYLFINASESGNIDTLRTQIRDYASTMSLDGSKKVIILDEADYLNPQSTQPALRGFMEEFSGNARFLLTCNFKDRILEPLQSRCSHVSFVIPKDERSKLASEFLSLLTIILKKEEVKFEQPALIQLLKMYFPDYRKILNAINMYAAAGVVDQDIFSFIEHTPVKEVVDFIKKKDYTKLSDWVEQTEFDQETVFEEFRKNRHSLIKEASLPDFDIAVWTFAESAHKVQNPKINMQGFLVTLMNDCEFI